MSLKRAGRIAARTAVALGIIALTFLGAELGFRLWKFRSIHMRAMWVTDPDLLYALNPDAPDSPGGFRGGLRETAAGTPLVVCLGGSTTYGYEIKASDAWPAALERALHASACPATVVNGGVSGYGSRQLLLRYERDIRAMEPAALIIYSLWNRTGALVDDTQFVPAIVARQDDTPLRRLLALCGTHSLLVRRIILRFGLLERTQDWAPDRHHEEFVHDIRHLVAEAIQDGIAVVVVGPPALYDVDLNTSEAAVSASRSPTGEIDYAERRMEYRRKMIALESIAAKTGARFVDMQSALDTRGGDRVPLFLDEMHLSIEGNRLVAQELSPVVQALVGCGGQDGGAREASRSHPNKRSPGSAAP